MAIASEMAAARFPGEHPSIEWLNYGAWESPRRLARRDIVRAFINGDALRVTATDLDGKVLWQKIAGPFASEHGLLPGRRIFLLMYNRRQELYVVGTAISSEYMYLTPPGSIVVDPAGYGAFWVKRMASKSVP